MKSHPENDMADLIRERFRKSGLSIKALADRADVRYSAAYGFVHGTRDPALSTAAKLCKVLGLELRPVRAKKRK